MKLFVSYSHEDKATAERVHSYFSALEFSVVIDESILSPGDEFEVKLLEEVADADGCILLLSKSALESDFVHKEVNTALIQLTHRANYNIYPLITESGVQPEMFPELTHLTWGDITVPDADEIWFKRVANKCYESANLTKRVDDASSQTAAAALSRTPDHERLLRLISNIFKGDINELLDSNNRIAEALLSQNHLITPRMVADKESKVKYDITVITKHLVNDTEDQEIRESVTKNLRRGINYTYVLVNPNKIVMKRLESYHKHHFEGEGCNKNLVDFYEADEAFFMPSSEIVIYDPSDEGNQWGYFQQTYGRRGDLNTVDIFLEVWEGDLKNLVNSVEAGIKQESLKKIDL